jgi:hypothetical protein
MPTKSTIGTLASAATAKEFADELSSYSTFTSAEIETLFPKKADREELLGLLQTVKSATDENDRRTKIVANIDRFASAVAKITMKVISV